MTETYADAPNMLLQTQGFIVISHSEDGLPLGYIFEFSSGGTTTTDIEHPLVVVGYATAAEFYQQIRNLGDEPSQEYGRFYYKVVAE